jgi:hypothetical protein
MNRVKLFELAQECGCQPGSSTTESKEQLRSKLGEYFETHEGKVALEKAPPRMLYTSGTNGEVEAHASTKELVINLLLQEF